MSKRWKDREAIRLVEIVERSSIILYTKRSRPRKTYPNTFWEVVAKEMKLQYGYVRSPVACRKKFQSLKQEIQPMLPTRSRTEAEERKPDAVQAVPPQKRLPKRRYPPRTASNANLFYLDKLFNEGIIHPDGSVGYRIQIVGEMNGYQVAKFQYFDPAGRKRSVMGVANGDN